MKSQQSGFTLIELVMVIVILGILAATAVPRFVDLSTDAQNAANKGVAGGIASASAINYATESVRGAAFDAVNTTACSNAVAALLVPDFDAALYTIATTTAFPATPANGDTAVCNVVGSGNPPGTAATFTMIYVAD